MCAIKCKINIITTILKKRGADFALLYSRLLQLSTVIYDVKFEFNDIKS